MDRRLVVLVEFALVPEQAEAFRRLILENAAASLRDEPGCRQFDVVEPEGAAGERIILYEVYDDAEAFEAHLATAHYADFVAASDGMVRAKHVQRLTFVAAGPTTGRNDA